MHYKCIYTFQLSSSRARDIHILDLQLSKLTCSLVLMSDFSMRPSPAIQVALARNVRTVCGWRSGGLSWPASDITVWVQRRTRTIRGVEYASHCQKAFGVDESGQAQLCRKHWQKSQEMKGMTAVLIVVWVGIARSVYRRDTDWMTGVWF
jgi:hypothetical protein